MGALFELFSGPLGGIARWAAGGLLIIVIFGGVIGLKSCQIQQLETKLAKSQRDVHKEQAERAACEADVATLRAAVDGQNKAIAEFKAKCEGQATAADIAAIRALADARRRQAQENPGSGAEAMNQWFRARFPSR